MGIISSIFWGKKESDEDRMKRAAQGQSVVGNVLGTSPYMREWGRQKQDIRERYEKQERSLRKQWRREDEEIGRNLEKVQGKYERKMGPEKAEKYYGQYEREHQRKIQRERDLALKEMEREKNEAIRNIQKNIQSYGDGA